MIIGGVNKLVLTLSSRSKYVLDYRNLKLYLSLGVKLTKIQRNTLILIQAKEKMLLIVLKNIFSTDE